MNSRQRRLRYRASLREHALRQEDARVFDFDEPVFDEREEDDLYGFCTHCGGEGYRQVDDPLWDDCDEFGEGPCRSCNGTGERSKQWVF